MAKRTRASRTSAYGDVLTTAPTEQSRVIPREVPEFRSAMTGLDGLSEAFSRFFGQASSAIDSFRKGAMIVEKQRIEQENAAQQKQAVSDFYSGREMDGALTNDLDYYDTYRGLLAIKTGNDAAVEFDKFYREEWLPANPQGDLESARTQWIKDNLVGGEDKEFEGASIASFVKATDKMVGDQRENAARIQIEQGKQNLTAALNADAKNGELTPERVAFYIEAARKIDPLNPHEAAPFVADAVMAAIEANPNQTTALLDLLTKPGTGVNGKSFAESFPEAFAEKQRKAVENWEGVNSFDERMAVDALKEKSFQFERMTDDELTGEFLNEWLAATAKFGKSNELMAIKRSFEEEIDRRTAVSVDYAAADAMLYGDAQPDPTILRKVMPDPVYMEQKLGTADILKADPVDAAAYLIRSKGAVAEDFKTQISGALLAFENPQAQLRALTLLNELQAGRTKGFAELFLSSEAQRYFDHVSFIMTGTDEPMDAVVQRVNEVRRSVDMNTGWKDLGAGDTAEKANAAVRDRVEGNIEKLLNGGNWLTNLFGEDVNIDPVTMQTISDYALGEAQVLAKQGLTWEQAVDKATSKLLGRATVIPANGVYNFSLDTDEPPFWTDAEGKVQPRVRLGFTVINPNTGKAVNTVEVYEKQLKEFGERRGSLIPGGDVDAVSLSPYYPQVTGVGSYTVTEGGDPIVFDAGDSFEVEVPIPGLFQGDMFRADDFRELMERGGPAPKTEKLTITFSGDRAETEAQLAQVPDIGGFHFVYNPAMNGYMLAYRPNFGDETGMSLQERIEKRDKEIE
jgi:hypothetical protein